jgi:hypothetical protein
MMSNDTTFYPANGTSMDDGHKKRDRMAGYSIRVTV